MKKILLLSLFLSSFASLKAQSPAGSYMNSFYNKELSIEATLGKDKLQEIYIEVDSKSSSKAYINIKGYELESFRTSLKLLRDKHLAWCQIAKDNNVTEMSKDFGISFPLVTIAWRGTKWWFSFDRRLNMKFRILTNNEMIATCVQKVAASSNKYIEETIYFVLQTAEDFDNLINALDEEEILKKLQAIQNQESLFQ